MSRKLTVPTVHLNGTSHAALWDAYEAAAHAVRAARIALEAAAPNARDYYVQGDAAFPAARAEHEARDRLLATVQIELAEILEALS